MCRVISCHLAAVGLDIVFSLAQSFEADDGVRRGMPDRIGKPGGFTGLDRQSSVAMSRATRCK